MGFSHEQNQPMSGPPGPSDRLEVFHAFLVQLHHLEVAATNIWCSATQPLHDVALAMRPPGCGGWDADWENNRIGWFLHGIMHDVHPFLTVAK